MSQATIKPSPELRRQTSGERSCFVFMIRVSAWVSSLLLVKTLQPGSWYNESVGKQLLNSGNLQRRVTFIPLNKIAGHRVDQWTIETAKRTGGRDNVCCVEIWPQPTGLLMTWVEVYHLEAMIFSAIFPNQVSFFWILMKYYSGKELQMFICKSCKIETEIHKKSHYMQINKEITICMVA